VAKRAARIPQVLYNLQEQDEAAVARAHRAGIIEIPSRDFSLLRMEIKSTPLQTERLYVLARRSISGANVIDHSGIQARRPVRHNLFRQILPIQGTDLGHP